jgi:predicted transcriptional regulator
MDIRLRRPQKTSPRAIQRAELEASAVEMRKRGATYMQIAKTLGVADTVVFDYVSKALARLNTHTTEELGVLRQMELQRLDSLMFSAWAAAQRGESRAIETVLKIMERRAKMLGLDAPTKLMLSSEEYDQFTAYKTKLKYDLDSRGAFEFFLEKVKDGTTKDLTSVLDVMMSVISEIGQKKIKEQKQIESKVVDIKPTKH